MGARSFRYRAKTFVGQVKGTNMAMLVLSYRRIKTIIITSPPTVAI